MQEDIDFTPRGLTKTFVSFAIAYKTSKFTTKTISDHTRFEDDTLAVEFTGSVIGGFVGQKLAPYTDKMVDKAADWLAEQKKQSPQQETTTK